MPFAPISSLIVQLIAFINQFVLPLILTLAFLMFVWGVYKYFIAGSASAEERQEGQKFVMWAVVGFFVIFSLWGLVWILLRTFGFGFQQMPPLPSFEASAPRTAPRAAGSPSGGSNPFGEVGGGSDGPAGAYEDCTLSRGCVAGYQCTNEAGPYMCIPESAPSGSGSETTRAAGESCTASSECESGLTCDFHATGERKTCGFTL